MHDTDWVSIGPGAEESAADLARALLALAHLPTHVRTDGNGTEFRVPKYVADLYMTPPEAPKPRRRTKKEGDE